MAVSPAITRVRSPIRLLGYRNACAKGYPAAAHAPAVTAPADLLDRARRRPRVHDRDPAARALRRAIRCITPDGDADRVLLRRVLADLDADHRQAQRHVWPKAAADDQPGRHVPRLHH